MPADPSGHHVAPGRSHRADYPRTVVETLDAQMRFRRTTIQAVLRFKRSRP